MQGFQPILSRRSFLKSAAASLALLGSGASLLDPLHFALAETGPRGRETWLLCDTPFKPEKAYLPLHKIEVTNAGSVNGLDVQSGIAFKIDTPFFGHTVTQNPFRRQEVITIEKWGRSAALIDLKEKKLVSLFEAADGNVFFGHAAFLAGSSNFITSEDDYDRANGQLVVRDSTNLKPVGLVKSYGRMPHECIMTDNGRVVVVANQKTDKSEFDSCVSWIEAASGKLLHQVVIGNEPKAKSRYGHLAMSSDGWVCTVGFTLPRKVPGNGRIRLISPEGKVMVPEIPSDIALKISGEVLSVAFLGDSGLVAATAPVSNKVIILDYKKQKYVNMVELPTPRGVMFDISASSPEFGMIVSSAKDKDIEEVKMSSTGNNLAIQTDKNKFGGIGSHLSRIYL